MGEEVLEQAGMVCPGINMLSLSTLMTNQAEGMAGDTCLPVLNSTGQA